MVILDTNVLSELMLQDPSPSVLRWFHSQEGLELFVSTISEAELRYGAEILPPGRRRRMLLDDIETMLREDFAGRVLPFDRDAARAYAVIRAARRTVGRPIGYSDCQIAAIAVSTGAAVATRDVGGFQGCGVEVINPWSIT